MVKRMFRRKIGEIGSTIYRSLFYPFVRLAIECKNKSIMKQGSYLCKGSSLAGKNYIGKRVTLSNTRVGFGSYINNDCDFSNTRIGKYTSIGVGVSTVLGSHPLDCKHVALHPAFYSKEGALGFTYADCTDYAEQQFIDKENKIQVCIGSDVWIGSNCLILEGTVIGDGAVVGAGSVVKGTLEPYGIYAGVPAKLIRYRFDEEKIKKLLKCRWWDEYEATICPKVIGGEFSDVEKFLSYYSGSEQ